MDVRKALSAALLYIMAFSALGISQDVPDDVVYTEVKKTLVNGNKGVLTCRFKGTPNAVYWKRGSDPENSPSIITWGYDNKYGPGYEDGSCDIDENYSLIIKNVTYGDDGRYICRVSSYKGVLIHNFTDATVTNIALKTEQSVLVEKGKVGVLPCQLNIRPRTVSWMRSFNETLVKMDLSRNAIDRGEQELFNITKDYSLIIYDVAVQHEDKYLCEVTDYDTEKTFQDETLLNVFAYPREPFPFIKECPLTSSSSCTLHIQSDRTLTMLTCQVEEFYPLIDVYFVRGAERVETLEAREWNNSDGTRNKLIKMETDGTGEMSFGCVANGLVGQGVISGSMTIHLIPDNKQSRVVVAVVVPVIFVFALIITGVLVYKWRKAHPKGEYERVSTVPLVHKQKQEDVISYIEIWMLVKYVVQQNVSKNLSKVLDHLLGNKSETGEDYYKELCKWKKGYTGASQREDLFDACRNQGLEAALDQLQGYSDSTSEVTSDDLEHTLWHVGGSDKLIELLKEFGALPEQIQRLQKKSRKDVIVGAMNILKYWRDVNSTRNQEVMLSLALEKIKYSPNDEDFFRIPEEQKCGLDKQEMQSLLSSKITSRHCTILVDAVMKLQDTILFGSKRKDVWLDDVIEKNRSDLFDSNQMIEDWWAEQNCSSYEKRCRLRSAADILEGQGIKLEASGEKWPSTKKLEQIVTLVPQSQLKDLWKALHISYDHDDSNDLTHEGKLLEVMCKWRDEIAEIKQEEKYRVLSSALKSIGFDGFLSRPKGKFIYKAELVDMALNLIMEDFRPFAHALGIKGTRFASYKRAFHPSHIELGTISLVFQLVKPTGSFDITTGKRFTVCNILNEAGYRKVTSRFMFASEPSFGELFALEASITQGDNPEVDVVPQTTEEVKPANKSTNNGAADIEESSSRAISQGNQPEVHLASHKPTGELNPAEKSNNNEAADTEQSPSRAATQFDEVLNETTGKGKLDEQSENNMATSIEQSPSRAAPNGVESNSENRQIPMGENKPHKTGLQETSKLDAIQSGTEVGQSSKEISEENTPTEESQGDRKNQILQSDLQETPRLEATLTTVDEEETQTDYVRDTEGRCGKSVDDLKRIIGLTDEELPKSSSNPVLMMFKIWKERICPELTDHRVVLAEGLKEIGKPHLVRDLINGEYHSNKTSIEFIEDMSKGMDKDRRISLKRLLKIKESKVKHPMLSDEMSQAIFDWVAHWTKEMKPSVKHQVRDVALLFSMPTEKAGQHRDFNDKLVENGFLDLAREIMNIEQYWLTK